MEGSTAGISAFVRSYGPGEEAQARGRTAGQEKWGGSLTITLSRGVRVRGGVERKKERGKIESLCQ